MSYLQLFKETVCHLQSTGQSWRRIMHVVVASVEWHKEIFVSKECPNGSSLRESQCAEALSSSKEDVIPALKDSKSQLPCTYLPVIRLLHFITGSAAFDFDCTSLHCFSTHGNSTIRTSSRPLDGSRCDISSNNRCLNGKCQVTSFAAAIRQY